MKIFTAKISECVCPICRKLTLLPAEVLAIKEKGMCLDCLKREKKKKEKGS